MTLTDAVLLGAVAIVAAYVLLVVVVSMIQPLHDAAAAFGAMFTAPFTLKFSQLDRHARLRALEKEIRRALGQEGDFGSQERADVVEAALAAQEIVVLDRLLRETVGRCLQAHWSVAEGLGAVHMSEAARHPWPAKLRQRIVDLTELLSQRLEGYPLLLDSPELMRLHLGLRWIAPTCCTCPYWTVTRMRAPRICPTAKALVYRNGSSHPSGGVIDGELIDDSERESS